MAAETFLTGHKNGSVPDDSVRRVGNGTIFVQSLFDFTVSKCDSTN